MVTMDNVLDYVQIATLIFLIIYVWKTWEMASATRKSTEISEKTLLEMKETREQETAPYIVVYCDIPNNDPNIYIVVKNIGKTIAEDININFNPSLCTNLEFPGALNKNYPILEDTIKSMPPGYEIKTILDYSPNYFSTASFPLKYEVNVSYTNSVTKKKIQSQQIIDMLPLKNIIYTKRYDLHSLVEVMKSIEEKIERKNREKDIENNREKMK